MKQKRSYKKPSFYVISSAMDGDKISIDKILDFYDPYISKSCIRPLYDEYGNVYIAVDMELKGRIREAIMKMILEFIQNSTLEYRPLFSGQMYSDEYRTL